MEQVRSTQYCGVVGYHNIYVGKLLSLLLVQSRRPDLLLVYYLLPVAHTTISEILADLT